MHTVWQRPFSLRRSHTLLHSTLPFFFLCSLLCVHDFIVAPRGNSSLSIVLLHCYGICSWKIFFSERRWCAQHRCVVPKTTWNLPQESKCSNKPGFRNAKMQIHLNLPQVSTRCSKGKRNFEKQHVCFVMRPGATSYDIMKVNKFGRFVMQSDRKQVAAPDRFAGWLIGKLPKQ